jgi:peroxiredoxin
VNDRAPDFTLPDQQGAPLTLAGARTARDFVVAAFYVKAFMGG